MYAERLVARLDLLHRCYEEGMRELGLPRVAPATDVDRPIGAALPAVDATAGRS